MFPHDMLPIDLYMSWETKLVSHLIASNMAVMLTHMQRVPPVLDAYQQLRVVFMR